MFSKKLFGSSKHRKPSDASIIIPRARDSISTDGNTNLSSSSTVLQDDPKSTVLDILPTRLHTYEQDDAVNRLGFSILHDPGQQRLVDIIFIHGLGGSSHMTWCKDRSLDKFWPQHWLPVNKDLQNARILTYGYSAKPRSSKHSSVLGIADFGRDLLYDLAFGKQSNGQDFSFGKSPIIFVAHSMGGHVVKKAYLEARVDDRYAAIASAIQAVIFLSTPHKGTDLAIYLNRLLAISFSASAKQYVEEMDEKAPFLRDLNEQFRHVASNLQIFSFYETLKTNIGGMQSAFIVDADAAKLGYPGEVWRSLNADHQGMCKFSNSSDPNYIAVLGAIQSLIAARGAADEANAAEQLEYLEVAFVGTENINHDFDLFSSRRMDGTCQWLVDNTIVSDWLYTENTSKILWLYGKPGRGKSVLASFIIQHLQESKEIPQFYFFRAGDNNKRTIPAFLNSIIIQAAHQNTSFRKSLVELVKGGFRPQNVNWRTIWKRVIIDTLFQSHFEYPIRWVVDGLDECNAPKQLLELLASVSEQEVPFKAVVSGRWDTSCSAILERTKSTASPISLCVDDLGDDFEAFIAEELRYTDWDPFITQDVIQQLLKKAEGSFLWVRLVLEQLQDCNTEQDINDRLMELPAGMNGLYRRMESNILLLQRQSDKDLAQSLISWILYSRNALSVAEIGDILEPKFGRILSVVHTIQRLCGHFVTVEGNETISIIHHTAREYLENESSLKLAQVKVSIHTDIFTQSLSVFCNKDIRVTLKSHPSKLFQYRATAWPYHLVAGKKGEDIDGKIDLLCSFFANSSVLVWIETVSSLRRLKTLLDASQALLSIVGVKRKMDAASDPLNRRFSDLEILDNWSRDLLKIVGKFGSSLLQKPDSIYTNIAPFCPRESEIYKAFGGKPHASITIRGQNEQWDDCLARVSIGLQSIATYIACSDMHIAVVNSAGRVMVWDATDFHLVSILENEESVSSICFSSNGAKLAVYGALSTRIWNSSSGELESCLQNPQSIYSLCMQFVQNDTGLLMGSDRRSIFHTSLKDGEMFWDTTQIGHLRDDEAFKGAYQNSPTTMRLSPDGDKIASAYRGYPVTISSTSSLETMKIVTRPQNPKSDVKLVPFAATIAWHPNNDVLIGIFKDGFKFILDLLNDTYTELSPTVGQFPTSITCSPDGTAYAVSNIDGSIEIFDYMSNTLIYQLCSDELISAFSFSKDGRRLYDVRDSCCTIWEPNSLVRLSLADSKSDTGFSSEGSLPKLISSSEECVDAPYTVVAMTYCAQASTVALGDDNGAIALVNTITMQVTRIAQTPTTIRAENLCWNHTGSMFCFSELGGSITVCQINHTDNTLTVVNTEQFSTGSYTNNIIQLMFTSDGQSLFVANQQSLQLWSLGPMQRRECIPISHNYGERYWIQHPLILGYFVAVGVNDIILYSEKDLKPTSTLQIQPFSHRTGCTSERGDHIIDRRMANVPIVEEVVLAITTFHESYVIVKISRKQGSRYLKSRLLVFATLTTTMHIHENSFLTTVDLPQEVLNAAEVPLNILSNGIFVFIDKDMWVCSWNIISSQQNPIKRHYAIPRDWLPTQSLGLLSITDDGTLICPRKECVSILESSIRSKLQ